MNQDIGLILINGFFYPLLKQGQRIPCKEKKINFASVTDEKSVRFLVTDAENPLKRTFEEPIVIDREGQGFMSEQFEVSCFVDPDLLLPFCHATFVSGLCTVFSDKCVDKGRFAHIADSYHHSTYRTVFNASSSVSRFFHGRLPLKMA